MENKSLAEMMGESVEADEKEEVEAEVGATEEEAETEVEAESEEGDEEGASPASKPVKESEEGLRKALAAERRRRQEAERERDDERRERARHQAGKQEEQPPQRPDPDDDPEGAAAWDERMQWQREFSVRCDLSRDTLMEIKGEEDYLEKENAFLEEAKSDPRLIDALRRAPNPAKYAYVEGQKLLERKELSDVDAYREKLRAEIEAEIGDDLDAYRAKRAAAKAKPGTTVVKQHARQLSKPNVPRSLADVSSSAPRSGKKGFDGPTPLDQLIP